MGNILYKYLDADGGLKMLEYSNLQFTNANYLNDPFDCHPNLIDFSNVPVERMNVWDKESVILLESDKYKQLRNNAYVCSLSKVHNSLLMWSYYCSNHKGVCIGIDMEKANKYLSAIPCMLLIGSEKMEVKYCDIIKKPDYFHDLEDFYRYQLSTKAKDWQHEQEVRLVLIEPSIFFVPMALPREPQKDEVVDWKEVRAYPTIGGECYESLYLGINIDITAREELIRIARKRNPDIKIFQMKVNPEAFMLKEELIKD